VDVANTLLVNYVKSMCLLSIYLYFLAFAITLLKYLNFPLECLKEYFIVSGTLFLIVFAFANKIDADMKLNVTTYIKVFSHR